MPTALPAFSDLLARARIGDTAARERLFGLVIDPVGEAPRLCGVVRRHMPQGDRARDLAEPADVLQSALLHGLVDLDAFRGSDLAEFVAWLRTILVRRLSRRHRDPYARVQRGLAADAEIGRVGGADSTPSEAFVLGETIERVRAAVADLPVEQRVVMQHRLAGLAAPAIADLLGLTAATVRKREQRAKSRLKEVLGA